MVVKRIVHVIEVIAVGGAEILLCNTIGELAEYEHLIISLFPPIDNSILPTNATHVCLGAASVKALQGKAISYRRIIRDFGPDLVHAHLYFATVFAKLFTPSSIPLLFTQHFEFSKNAEKWPYRLLDRAMSRQRHYCIAVSQVVLNDYKKVTRFKGKCIVLGNYVPDVFFRLKKEALRQPGSLRMVALGNIKPIKNHRFLLEAFEHMQDLPVSCDVYGEGPQRRELQEEARRRNLNIHFRGAAADASKILLQYDLYIMPSFSEGFPLALFEAMAASLPTIVSDIPVFHELLGEDGEYVSLQEPAQVRSIVEKYLQHADLLFIRGKVMKQTALQKASRETYLRRLRAIYAQAINMA